MFEPTWSAGFLVFVVWLSFLHAPFIKYRGDTYSQVVKMVQIWSGVHLVMFHFMNRYVSQMKAEEPVLIFFPMFILFAFTLYTARGLLRGVLPTMCVAYCPNLLTLWLNALLMAVLLTFHYGFCLSIDSLLLPQIPFLNVSILPVCWEPLTPGQAGFNRLTIVQAYLAGLLFVAVDMLYKYLRNNASCGILFAEVAVTTESEKRLPMVQWYSIEAITAGLRFFFGTKVLGASRLDVRAVQAASRVQRFFDHFATDDELWFDFIADVGDGFNSTYAMARLLAQPKLTLTRLQKVAKTMVLPRAKLVVVGGDLAYPYPDPLTYENRLVFPYNKAMQPPPGKEVSNISLAAPEASGEPLDDGEAEWDGPQMFAIPGNHDWIDGANTFMHYFATCRFLGGWRLPQKSSYFCLRLPHNWWIVCLDMGLFEDIDTAQLQYFLEVVATKFNATSNVIVVTHEPSWLHDAYFGYSEENFMGPLANTLLQTIGRRLRLRLAGDIHNYSRYMPMDSAALPPLVISGGGGAFMHGTDIQGNYMNVRGARYKLACAFPRSSPTISILKRMFAFRLVNWQFDLIGGFLYFFMVASMFPMQWSVQLQDHSFSSVLQTLRAATLHHIRYLLFESRSLSTVFTWCTLLAFIGMIPANKKSLPVRLLMGTLHWAIHVSCAVGLYCAVEIFFTVMAQSHLTSSTASKWSSVLVTEMQEFLPSVVPFYDDIAAGVSPILVDFVRTVAKALDVVEGCVYLRFQAQASGTLNLDSVTYWLYFLHTGAAYWLVSCPAVALVLGAYFAICATRLGMYLDEAYSSWQIEDFKNFVRLNLTKSGDLNVYVVGVRRVPRHWETDPGWTEENASVKAYAHTAHYRLHPSELRSRDPRAAKEEIIDTFSIAPLAAESVARDRSPAKPLERRASVPDRAWGAMARRDSTGDKSS